MEFFATCPAGFESLLADELRALGITSVRPLKGQVAFEGPLQDAYRTCLWSRMASRVIAVLARTDARDADELYEGLAQVAWEEHLPRGASFAIDAHGTNAQLRNTQFIALRSKDALVDRMQSRTGARPMASTKSPDLNIVVRVSRNRATVGIDLAGAPLFRRGYELSPKASALASLRADYAAALLALGGWPALCRREEATLLVPFTGAGSIAVEAAAIALDRAPGLIRGRWGFEGWACHDPSAWNGLVEEAQARRKDATGCHILLSDMRAGYEQATRQALRAAGIDISPTFHAQQMPDAAGGSPALIACDLTWIDEQEIATKATALSTLAASCRLRATDVTAAVLATDTLPDLVLGEPEETSEAIVGRDEASLRRYRAPFPEAPRAGLPGKEEVDVLAATSSQFAARLAKVYKLRRKWARREDVSCYRIYDSDLPDYAVSIDLFEGSLTPGRWLQIYEYAPPKNIDETKARARLLDVVSLAPRLLDVRPQDTFVRVRTKARGGSQYADEARHPGRQRPGRGRAGMPALPAGAHLVDEGGLTFEVNFSTRLDCGIFLDHRDTRAMLREMAKQTKGSKRFLNLFAYTGSATCYAADGGVRYTTTVDLSRPSLDWARRNMERNGFTGDNHEFVQADVVAWVGEQRRTKNRWDLVFCDVPTFSNSQRMRTSSFDVQRDHAELLIGVSRLLTRDGVCVFSCNLRTFRMDVEALAKAGVVAQDITEETIPEDFARNQRIHRCYLVRRAPRA